MYPFHLGDWVVDRQIPELNRMQIWSIRPNIIYLATLAGLGLESITNTYKEVAYKSAETMALAEISKEHPEWLAYSEDIGKHLTYAPKKRCSNCTER